MSRIAGREFWIIGASEGLGRALARGIVARGGRVVLSARSAGRLQDLAAELAPRARVVTLDVTDDDSADRAVREAGSMDGAVDGVIYSAGRYEPMRAQDWDAAESVAMAQVNFVGALRVLGRVVPEMARRGRGQVMIVGSLSAHRGLPGAIGYGASKAALLSLAQTMRADLAGTGVTVQIANPGFIRTRLTEKNDFDMPSLMDPEDAAARILDQIESGRFETNFPRPFALLFTLGRFLPLSWFHRIFRRAQKD